MNIDIQIPESLNEVTLYQYQRFDKLVKENKPSDFVNQKTIEIFCKLELKDVARIKLVDVSEILVHLNKILNQKPQFKQTFKLGKYEFGFIPNLEEITSGEFIDCEEYLKDTDTLHKAMAVLFRPITKKYKDYYDIEPYETAEKYSEVLKYMPLDIALGTMVFFYDLMNDSLKGLKDYILNQAEQSEAIQNHLEKNGVGINQFTQQLEEIFSNLTALQHYQSKN